MKREIIDQLCGDFERLVHVEQDSGLEFWLARELQSVLGYQYWRNFEPVVDKAKTACHQAGFDVNDHFALSRKMVELGSGAQREIDDLMLTRYACKGHGAGE